MSTLSRRHFLRSLGLGAAALAAPRLAPAMGAAAGARTNVLLITADDLNCDSVGVFGCKTPDITPHIDRLAGQSMRFTHAHVTIAVCQPCRSVLMTGRYPHRSGGEGFHRITKTDTPLLIERLAAAGYRCGILGKVGHCTPKASFQWDMRQDMPQLGMGRNPGLYHKFAKGFMEEAAKAGHPFFLMANSHDPHRPFSGSDQEKRAWPGKTIHAPSRTYRPEEVRTPGFLPDLPEVRREIAEYYSSVRRCDDTVGAVLAALDEAGHADDTLVIFLSDHGMALPFAKTNCYLHSTHTPWMVRWPGKVKPGSVDTDHFISGIDLMPTILDALGLEPPGGMDGRSFLPLLRGEKQGGRTLVFTQFHQTAGRRRYPMRCVQNARFGYIFNAWSDGRRVFRNESQSGRTMKAMREAAESSDDIRARVNLFLYRTVEEFYDFANDPDARKNLAGDPAYKKDLDAMRSELERWMVRTADPALNAFRRRDDPAALAAFMAEEDARARAVGKARKKRKKQS